MSSWLSFQTSFTLSILYVCKSLVSHIKQLSCCRMSFCRVCISKIIRSLVQLVTKKTLTFSVTKCCSRFLVFCSHRKKGRKWTGELGHVKHQKLNPQPDNSLRVRLFAEIGWLFCSWSHQRRKIQIHQNWTCVQNILSAVSINKTQVMKTSSTTTGLCVAFTQFIAKVHVVHPHNINASNDCLNILQGTAWESRKDCWAKECTRPNSYQELKKYMRKASETWHLLLWIIPPAVVALIGLPMEKVNRLEQQLQHQEGLLGLITEVSRLEQELQRKEELFGV